jgi:hypothetical protein
MKVSGAIHLHATPTTIIEPIFIFTSGAAKIFMNSWRAACLNGISFE